MSTLDIGFPSQDIKQSDGPLHGDSGDAQYFIFVNAGIYRCKWERMVGNANCWHICNKTWNVISDYMIVFTSYNYFLPSLVACTLWHITSYFDNSNGHWPRHDTVWRWFYLSDIVGIPGGVTNHQDVANENRCCYHHLRKGQVIFFYIVHNHWVAQIGTVGGMSIDLCNDDLDVNFHSFISFTYLGFTKQRNLPTTTKQRKKLPSRYKQTTKQRKNLPSRKRIQKMPFLHSTSCLQFWNMWKQIKNNHYDYDGHRASFRQARWGLWLKILDGRWNRRWI